MPRLLNKKRRNITVARDGPSPTTLSTPHVSLSPALQKATQVHANGRFDSMVSLANALPYRKTARCHPTAQGRETTLFLSVNVCTIPALLTCEDSHSLYHLLHYTHLQKDKSLSTQEAHALLITV